MSQKKTEIQSKNSHKKIVLIFISLGALALVLFLLSSKSDRSTQNFCDVYATENVRLESLPGDTYPSGVFNEDISDAGEFATSFSKLEKVAPEEIRSDISTLKSIYKKIYDDPSQAIAVGLSGVKSEENVVDWIESNCNVNSED